MKSNVDLTEQGHFSEGWMTGGWRAKGVFRKRKPMKTSQQFKDILKMGKDKKYGVSSMIEKLFGIKASFGFGDVSVDFNNAILTQTNSTWATTSTQDTWATAPIVTWNS